MYLRSGTKDNLPVHNSRRKLAHGTGVSHDQKRLPARKKGLDSRTYLQYILYILK